MKRFAWFEILLVVVVMSISLYAAFSDGQNFSWRWYTRDDAYYYFKVAQNISEGHGSTFDGINKTNGYHPLWMLICIPIFALARFDLILPLRILFLLMSGLSVATAVLLFRLIGRVFAPVIGAFAALYWVFSVNVLVRFYKQGLETGIAAFFIVLFVYKLAEFERTWRERSVTTREWTILGAIGALVIFSRLDLVFLVALAGIWLVFRRSPIRYFMPLDIASVAFSVLLAFVIKAGFPEYYELARPAVTMLAVSLLVKIPLAYLFGLYQRANTHQPRSLFRSLIFFVAASSAMTGIAMIVLARLMSFDVFPRMVLVYDAIATFILFAVIRLIPLGLRTAETTAQNGESPLATLRTSWKIWLSDGARFYGVAFGALGLYMIWSKFAFGTFSPVSGQIKRWWGSLSGRVYGGTAKNVEAFFGISYSGDSNTWHPVSTFLGNWAEHLYRLIKVEDTWRYILILLVFALLFYIILRVNSNKGKTAVAQFALIPLLCGAILQVFYYHMLGYSAYKEWYWVIQLIVIVLVFSLMLGMLYLLLPKLPAARSVLWGLALLYGIFMGARYWSYIQNAMPYGRWAADEPYMDISAFLEEHTEPGSIIGMTGGGNAAYFIRDRTIINMDGLINSYEYFELLKEKEAGSYLAEIKMNYVLANLQILNSLPYRGQYHDYFERTGLRYGGKELVRYGVQPE
ncbi:MAG TPA: hypothetical protein VFY26_05260 [Anaerolineales bacterium]|nr:hypothetical protein [Anaerolineales bacterium]